MNSTNGSASLQPSCPTILIMDTAADRGMKITSLFVIMVLALVFNSLVITIFAKNPSLHKTVNYFLVNMAVSDLIVPVAAIPKHLVILISGSYTWQVTGTAGLVLCKLQPLLQDMSPAVSIFTIVCITVDRFFAVIRPLRITMISDKVRAIIIGLIWILGILYYTHYFYTLKLVYAYNGDAYCLMDWGPLDHVKSTTILVTLTVVLYGAIPWILVIVLYVVMVMGLKRAKLRIQANVQTFVRHRRITSVTRQAFIIGLVFAVCNFPLAVLYLLIAYVYKFGCIPVPYWKHVYFAAEFMLYSNAVLNPCICLFLNENYRNGLWRLLRLKRTDRIHPGLPLREEMREEPLTRST